MIPFFVDIFTEPDDVPLLGRRIAALGMGYPGESNDLVVEVVAPEDYADAASGEDADRSVALTFRNRVMKAGGTAIGRARAPMLGVRLTGWGVRTNAWPRLAFELLKARAPLYDFAAPMSRRFNDCDMADLKAIVSQGSYLPDGNDMNLGTFASFFGMDRLQEYPPNGMGVKDAMEQRIYAVADIYGRYADFSGKE